MRAAAYAAGLARRQRTKLIAVYARTSAATLLSLVDRSGLATSAVLEAQDELEHLLRAEIAAWGADSELVVRQGDPLTVLSDVAMQTRADAVIVGSSARRLVGSSARRLVGKPRPPDNRAPWRCARSAAVAGR